MARTLDKFVRRYTSLSSALDVLLNRRITLLSPSTWDDQNDVTFMELYRAHAGRGSVLALCCTMASETYHHWRIFTEGREGICLEFDRGKLEALLAGVPDLRTGRVRYVKIRDLADPEQVAIADLPFVKRLGYSDEREWRMVMHHPEDAIMAHSVPLDPACLTRIVLNPWMPKQLGDNLRAIFRGIPGCGSIKIEASGLTNSQRWKDAGRRLVAQREG